MENVYINPRVANCIELIEEKQLSGAIKVDSHFDADHVIDCILSTIALNYDELSTTHIALVEEAMHAAGNGRSLDYFKPKPYHSRVNHFLMWYGCPEVAHWMIDVYSLDTYVIQCIKIHNLYVEGYLPLYNDWIDNLQVYTSDKFSLKTVMEYSPLTDCVNRSLHTLFDEFTDFEFNNYGWYMTLADITAEFVNSVASCVEFSKYAEANDNYIRKNMPTNNTVADIKTFSVFTRYRALLAENSRSQDFLDYEESIYGIQMKGSAMKCGFNDSRFDTRLHNKSTSHRLACWKQDFVRWITYVDGAQSLQIDGAVLALKTTSSVEYYCLMAKNIGERELTGVFDKPIFGKQRGLDWNKIISEELSTHISIDKCCIVQFNEHGIEVIKGRIVAGESLHVKGRHGLFVPHDGKQHRTPIHVGVNETGAVYCDHKFLLVDPKSISFKGA